MEKSLTRRKKEIWYFGDGQHIEGIHNRISGDVSGISGNIDDCKITEEERKVGVLVNDLIGQ